MSSTASLLIGLARNLMRTDEGSDVPVMADEFLLKALDDAKNDVLRAFRRGGGNEPLSSIRELGFDLVENTAIDDVDGIETTDTEIAVDSHSFPDLAGAAVIWRQGMPDIFTYSSKTATLFSGVEGIAFAHEDGDVVQPLYKLPASFKTFRPTDGYGDGLKVNGVPYRFTEGPPEARQFTIYDDGSNKYLWLPRGITGQASAWCEKTSDVIDNVADVIPFDSQLDQFFVWRLVQVGTFGREDSLERYALAKAEAIKNLQEVLTDRNVGDYVRTRPITPHRPRYIDHSLTQPSE